MTGPERLIKEAQQRFYRQFPALRPKCPPSPPQEGRLVLGRDKEGTPFALDALLLAAHVDLVGGTGGGKSSAMRHLAWLHMEADSALNRATVIIDPHGLHPDSLFRTTLRRIVEGGLYKRKRVWVVDPNSEFCTGLKLLQSEAEAAVMADHMVEAFERMQGDENLLEKPTLRRALHGLLAVLSQLGWSLAEADLLLDPADPHGIREWALDQVTDRYARKALLRLQYLAGDPRLRKEFEIETIGSENRLAPLLSSRAMRAVVGHQLLDMREVLDGGGVLLVNTAGHNAVYETAGDLLGKLVMRAVLFAAKRRTMDSLALVFADECARFVSQDWERALAELRKYHVGIVSAHQTFAMLGGPGDPVREAIEKIPATKMAFRLNSMPEAAQLAPDLMRLNLELPVEVLTKEAVVDHAVRRMRSTSAGHATSQTDSFARTHTMGTGRARTRGSSEGESETRTKSRERSRANTRGWSHSVAAGESYSSGSTYGHTEGAAESEGETESTSRASGHTLGGGNSEERGTSSGASFAQSFDVPVNSWRSGETSYANAAGLGIASGRNVTAGRDSGRSHATGRTESWADSESTSTAHGTQRSHSHSSADSSTQSETFGASRIETDTESGSTTEGEGWGESFATGVNRSRSFSTAESEQLSTGTTRGTSYSRATSSAAGWSEALVPVLEMRPSAVHSLENVRHMAAEMLCSLPTGVAVVRTIKGGRIEGAVVRVPYRECRAVTDEQYAADLRTLIPHSIGRPMTEAMRAIEERENRIIATASSMKVVCDAEATSLWPAEPKKGYRVPAPAQRKRQHNGEGHD